jgi:hypothetical protein
VCGQDGARGKIGCWLLGAGILSDVLADAP